MKLHILGANQTELHFNTHATNGGDRVLFSYETPVAAYINGAYYRTDAHFSPTTSRHINAWLSGVQSTPRHQAWFDALLDDVRLLAAT